MQEREQGRRCPSCDSLFRLPVFRTATRVRLDEEQELWRRCPDCLEWAPGEDYEYEDMTDDNV
jgi:hypothetical protein